MNYIQMEISLIGRDSLRTFQRRSSERIAMIAKVPAGYAEACLSIGKNRVHPLLKSSSWMPQKVFNQQIRFIGIA